MSIPVVISLFGIFVAAVVSLLIAAMQRKQMRQIELHRRDASFPLVPPPHPFTQFLTQNSNHWFVIGNIALDSALLSHEIHKQTPITRWDVFAIALFTFMLCSLVMFELGILAYTAGRRSVRGED
jgi:hypothetical protein